MTTEHDRPPIQTTPFRVVLCDDNLPDRELFRSLIRRHPAIQLVGEAATFQEALEHILRERVDVLFLEAEVGGQFLLDECPLIPPAVKLIFLTRHPSTAAQAFELDAVDFLVKPLLAARLSETMRRLLRIEWSRPSASAPSARDQLLIPFERGRRGVSLDEIGTIQAFGNYTRVLLEEGRSEIVLRSLAKWEKVLPMPPFVRVHRHTIVNVARVRGLEESEGVSVLRLEGSDENIPVSRRSLPEVRQILFSRQS